MSINFLEISGGLADDPEAIAGARDFDELANLITSLVKIRKQQRLTQADIARRLGSKQSVVSDIERVGGNPTVRTLQRYARAVGCELKLRPLMSVGSSWAQVGTFETQASHTRAEPVDAPLTRVA